MRTIQKTIAATILALALMAPASAFAAESSVDGYSSSQAQLEGTSQDPSRNSSSANSDSDSSSLPFTGLDLGLLAAGGVALAGVGFGMRRFTRRPDMA